MSAKVLEKEHNTLGEIQVKEDATMKNIARYRNRKRLTQEQLAKLMGVSQTTINLWEKGKRTPSLSNAKRLARVLNCKLDQIV